MSTDRITRVNELIRREIAEKMFQLLAGEDVDISSVTVTKVVTARNLRYARVLISVRGDEQAKAAAMAGIKKHRNEFQSMINRDLKLKYTPRLTFELDESIEKGDRMLNLLAEMEDEEGVPE